MERLPKSITSKFRGWTNGVTRTKGTSKHKNKNERYRESKRKCNL